MLFTGNGIWKTFSCIFSCSYKQNVSAHSLRLLFFFVHEPDFIATQQVEVHQAGFMSGLDQLYIAILGIFEERLYELI